MSSLGHRQVLGCVERASARAVTAVHGDLKRGTNSLASIAATAPLLGFVLTVFRISGSFGSFATSASSGRAAIAQGLSESMLPASLGLAPGILALWFYRYLSSQVETFDLEMKNASVDLVNRLAVHLGRMMAPAANPAQVSISAPVEQDAAHQKLPLAAVVPPLDGPRLSVLTRSGRHGVFELLWPRLSSDLDADSILYGGMLVSFSYAFLGWLTCYWQGGPKAGLVTLAFFVVAGLAIRMGSRFSILCVLAFFVLACSACVVAYRWSFESICLAAAPLLLVTRLRATRLLAAIETPGDRTKTAQPPAWPRNTWPALRQMPRILVGPLSCCECAIVLCGTVLTFYSVDAVWSMEPTIHEGDWIVAVNAPLIREICCGDVVALGGEWYSGTAAGRVIGLPGDLVQMKSGRLLRNGQYLNEPYRKEPDRGRDGSFSIDLEPVPYGDRWQYESAYGFLVSEDTYFVLSDGRDDVLDSRIAGSVLQAQIIARPVLAYSPLAKPWAWPRLIR